MLNVTSHHHKQGDEITYPLWPLKVLSAVFVSTLKTNAFPSAQPAVSNFPSGLKLGLEDRSLKRFRERIKPPPFELKRLTEKPCETARSYGESGLKETWEIGSNRSCLVICFNNTRRG